MEKMTSREFRRGMEDFLKIIEHQPNLLPARQPCENLGTAIANTAVAFIDRLHELRSERVGDPEE